MAASKNSIPNIPTHDAPTSARETADKPNFEKFLSTLGVDGSPLSLEKAHLVAEYWDHNTEYTASAEKGLMSLLDGMGKDRELTIAFQRSIGMGAAADGYIASVKQHRSSTFDAFWKYYEEQKRIAEGRPAPSPLDNPSDFSALLEYAFSDDGTLSDAELDAIARYLGGAEATWKETRMRVASLLDDVATENTADRVLGRKFQQAIGHDESDGLVGGKKESKTIARFWQYYRERRGDGTAVPATPARPSGTTSVAPAASAEALDLPLAIAAQTVADTLRSNKDLSIDQQAKIIAYVRGDISRVSDLIREAAWRALPEADRERFLDRAQGEVRLLIARKFGFAYDASMDEMAFALNFAAATKDGRSPDQRRQDKLVTFAEAVDSRSAGRYVNPRALQAALEKYASPEDGTDWESFARDILSRDIASLRLAMRDELDLRKKWIMEAVLAENLTVDADVAKMAAGKLDGLNQRLRAKGKKQGAETLDEIRLDTPADRAVFLHQAEVAAKPGHVYYGGIASYYRAKFPSVDMDAAERLLAGQDVRGIARMAVALSEGRTLAGYSEHQPARGELQQLRGLLLAVYGQMKDGKISATDARFAPAERDGSTDILRQRETLLNIGLIILREIATDPDITSRKSNESYIGEIHIVDPDIKQGEITATRHMDAERLRRTHALRGKLDTPVLQVSVDGRLYAIEYRSPEGWTVVPPSDAMQGGKWIVIPSIDKDGIASALYEAKKLIGGSK